MCNKPFLRLPNGVSVKTALLSEDARNHATPHGCGQCLPCRINKSRTWVVRLLLEQMQHESSLFLTLTYNDENYPTFGSLEKDELQKFIKRLRDRLKPRKIRFYAVGEYGECSNRPHYHMALFNCSQEDQPEIEAAWTKGFVHVGTLSNQSARYISGYVIKGMTKQCDPRLGEWRKPEFMTCSRNPGIAAAWAVNMVGKQGVVEIMKKNPIDKITFHRSNLPIGRYLKNKLVELSGVGKEAIEQAFYEYQFDLIKKAELETEVYADAVIKETKSRRIAAEVRARRYQQRRQI